MQDRDAIIIDDMISTGATLARAAHLCRKHGAARVLAAASHGLFCGAAAQALDEADLDLLVVTDTVSLAAGEGMFRDKLTILTCAEMFAEAIRRLHCGESVSELAECHL